MSRGRNARFLAAMLCIAGCQTYQPLPLDDQSVERGLTDPNHHDLQARVNDLKNPLLKPIDLHPEQGLTPDEAALIAVVCNPALRAQRDARGISQAALLEASILPNPQLTFDYAWNTGGTVPGNINPYGIGINYDINSLISHSAKEQSAEFSANSVDLDIAWQEWQTAEAARAAVYDLISLQGQQKVLAEMDDRLADNLKVIRQAADARLKTAVDLAAAEAAGNDAHAARLQADRDAEHELLALKRAMGFSPDTKIALKSDAALPTKFTPSDIDISADLEKHRLDLLALKQGYQSQEQTLVAAVLNQFPRINLGFNRNVDNTKVRSLGLGVSIDIPIFDRNQGNIAAEKATRQKLYDEYLSRVFDARADIAQALADIKSLNQQITQTQSAIPNLQKLVDVYKEAVDHGNADVLSYYAAWNNLAQKKLDLLKLQQQLADNRIALEIAAGRYFNNQMDETNK